MKNILFYNFVKLDNLEELRNQLHAKLKSLDILGTILLAKEGMNGCLTGEDENISQVMDYLHSIESFKDTEFKIADVHKHGFDKLKVKVRDEIITSHFGEDILDHKGQYIEPEELKRWYEEGEDFVIVDGRNTYESKIGHFKNAICPDVDIFSESEKMFKDLEGMQDKKIVTYCTGGIRCEKLSGLLKKHGFKNTYQLHGGIIRYGIEQGDDYWEGKCFVFDKRVAINIDPNKETQDIAVCEFTGEPCSEYHNCAHVDCDRRFIAKEEALKEHDYCCSKECQETIKAHPEKISKERKEYCGCLAG